MALQCKPTDDEVLWKRWQLEVKDTISREEVLNPWTVGFSIRALCAASTGPLSQCDPQELLLYFHFYIATMKIVIQNTLG